VLFVERFGFHLVTQVATRRVLSASVSLSCCQIDPHTDQENLQRGFSPRCEDEKSPVGRDALAAYGRSLGHRCGISLGLSDHLPVPPMRGETGCDADAQEDNHQEPWEQARKWLRLRTWHVHTRGSTGSGLNAT
jgi:hypothetical protein